MFITVNRVGNSLTGAINGEPYGLSYSDQKYQVLLDIASRANAASTMEGLKQAIEDFKLASKEDFKSLIEHKSPYLYVNSATGKFFLKVGVGQEAVVSSEPLPLAFVDRIVKSVELGLEILPLVKAWSRFLRNPNYSAAKAGYFANYINKTTVNQEMVVKLIQEQGLSTDLAVERATTLQTPITQEGLLCTYKVSDELTEKWVLGEDGEAKQVPINKANIDPYTGLITYDTPSNVEDRIFYPAVMGLDGGDAFYCGSELGHIIRVGNSHRLANWDQVDTNDARSGVKGLHVGNIDYIRGFQGQGTETHNVFLDPMNIGAFTDDGTGAIRTKEYFVHSSFAGVNRGIYHSSEYAKETDKNYEEMYLEAVKKHEASEAEYEEFKTQIAVEAKALRSI